uniref:Uncharacterized protein n=1 Tax=Globodera rostochiensis TaxID=31243 RepID=A0A914HQH0_GLORO
MSITKSTDRTPKLDKLNPIQLISLDKLSPIQLIRILLSQSLITLDKLNPIQLIRILLSKSLITRDKLNPIQLIRILLSHLITLDQLNIILPKMSKDEEIDKTVAKELGLSFKTIYKWKQKLCQTKPKHKHSHSEQKELMKRYYEIKDKTPKIRDGDIAKMLKIGRTTLFALSRCSNVTAGCRLDGVLFVHHRDFCTGIDHKVHTFPLTKIAASIKVCEWFIEFTNFTPPSRTVFVGIKLISSSTTLSYLTDRSVHCYCHNTLSQDRIAVRLQCRQ